MSLFNQVPEPAKAAVGAPLAERMRPRTLDEYVISHIARSVEER